MNLSELQKEAHAIAVAHGWWDIERTFGDLIALVHSELSEALEAYREYGLEGWSSLTMPYHPRTPKKPEGVASELADVVIRVVDMTEYERVDLTSTIASQLEGVSEGDMSRVSFGDWIAICHVAFSHAFEMREYENPAEETWDEHLADGCHIVFRMAAHYGIDLDAAIEAKMEYNRTRPYRHGGKAL